MNIGAPPTGFSTRSRKLGLLLDVVPLSHHDRDSLVAQHLTGSVTGKGSLLELDFLFISTWQSQCREHACLKLCMYITHVLSYLSVQIQVCYNYINTNSLI